MMIGNLLSAGYLQDKIGRPETVSTILDMLNPKQPKQFVAVTYCLAQIVQNKQPTKVFVGCNGILKIVSLLDVVNEEFHKFQSNPLLYMASEDGDTEKAGDGPSANTNTFLTLKEGVAYIWGILSNLMVDPDYFKVYSYILSLSPYLIST
jgi:hypothetical protein